MRIIFLTIAIVLSGYLVSAVSAQTTAFTFQGKLVDNGNPASGTYQMDFRLFTAATGGTQLGPTLSFTSVTVSSGVFTTTLDFDDDQLFNGLPRFLEIRVRRDAAQAYTVLAPRQQILSAPYSIKTKFSDQATNADQLAGVSGSEYLRNNGDGSSLTNLNADYITSGKIDDARLSANVPLLNSSDKTLRVFDGTRWLTFVPRLVSTNFAFGSSSWQCAFFNTTGIFQVPGQSLTFTKISGSSRIKLTYFDDFSGPPQLTLGTVEVRQILSPSTSASLTPLFYEDMSNGTNRPRMVGYISNLPAGTITVGIVVTGNVANSNLNCSRLAAGRFLLEAEEVP